MTAQLLIKQGYQVAAVYCDFWKEAVDDTAAASAQAVAEQLGIPLTILDRRAVFKKEVVDYFLQEYVAGRTPNPCVRCNKRVKLGELLHYAQENGFDYLATGHYLRLKGRAGKHYLERGDDPKKDQSYFLCQLTQEQLKYVLFPIGELTKPEVRKIADEYHLATAKKKDSTGICFIGERDFAAFLGNYLRAKSGKIVSDKGQIMGVHQGLMNYTIGQRKGLGIGGNKELGNDPWFVIGKNLTKNELIVGQGFYHPLLMANFCTVEDVNWIPKIKFEGTLKCHAKFRYRQNDIPVEITWNQNNQLNVKCLEPVRAITPGQAAVFYLEDVCLGGGTIDKVYMDDVLRIY